MTPALSDLMEWECERAPDSAKASGRGLPEMEADSAGCGNGWGAVNRRRRTHRRRYSRAALTCGFGSRIWQQ